MTGTETRPLYDQRHAVKTRQDARVHTISVGCLSDVRMCEWVCMCFCVYVYMCVYICECVCVSQTCYCAVVLLQSKPRFYHVPTEKRTHLPSHSSHDRFNNVGNGRSPSFESQHKSMQTTSCNRLRWLSYSNWFHAVFYYLFLWTIFVVVSSLLSFCCRSIGACWATRKERRREIENRMIKHVWFWFHSIRFRVMIAMKGTCSF